MSEPIVQIEDGKVRGRILENVNGGKFGSFQGIPFGKPPIGKLRFKAPQPAEPWTGIFDATKEGNESLQKNFITREIYGSEDCLNLNVYTPQTTSVASSKLKPVMVFIYGGAFVQGSNKTEFHGPEFLLTEDIVLVVINYRLGLLGFLSFEDPSLNVPGNAGFKDMVLALRWVQKNIKNFSGDPNNVTLFGESAGGASAHLLMLSPMAQGLFHKVIAQSGCALNGWIYGKRTTKELAKSLGYNTTNEKDILPLLQNASIEELFKGQKVLEQNDIMANNNRFIGLVVEKPTDEEPFFTRSPIDIFLSGSYNKIPIIMGFNNMEGMLIDLLVKKEKQSIYWENLEVNVPGLLNLKKGSELSKSVAYKIYEFYIGSGKVSKETHLKQIYDVTTDNCFLHGIYRSIKRHASTSNTPVYMYQMTVETSLNIYKTLAQLEYPGVCHGDDLGYLFTNMLTGPLEKDSKEDISQRRFVRLWTNFAKYGKPTIGDDPLVDVNWKPVDRDNVYYLNIGEELRLERNPEPKRMKFWDEIFEVTPLTSKL